MEIVDVQVVVQTAVVAEQVKIKENFEETVLNFANARNVGDAVVNELASTDIILPYASLHPLVVKVSQKALALPPQKLPKIKIDQSFSVKSGELKF